MGFLQNQLKKQLEAIKQSIPDERLDELEAKGIDVSEYRQAKNKIKENERASYEKLKNDNNNPTNLSKLDAYVSTPRSTDTDFFKAVAGKVPWFGKEKWKRKYSEAPIVYRGIVKVEDGAFKEGNKPDTMYHAITLVAVDREHQRNEEWLINVINQLQDMLHGQISTPNDCEEIIDVLRNWDNEGDWRSGKLEAEIVKGAEVYYAKSVLTCKNMPNLRIPSNNIIPVVCNFIPQKKGQIPLTTTIPPSFYTN